MKRILVLIPSPLSFKQFLIDVYLSLNYEVHVVCKQYESLDLYNENFNYHYIDFERNLSFCSTVKARNQLIKLVGDLKPDLIHAHFSASIFLLSISKKRWFPYCIGTIQGSLFLATDNWFKRKIFKVVEVFSIKRLNKIFVLTDDDFVALRKKSSNVFLQKAKGFGVNLNYFDKANGYPMKRKDLGIEEDDMVLIYVGRLVPFKGFNLVLNIFNHLYQKKSTKYKLIVCGVFDKFHKNILSKDEEGIWNNNPNIIKAGFTNDVRSYLSLADLNIFPSKREGYPVNIMEAIAMGVPTITSSQRGCRHSIVPLVNGIIVESFEIKDWVELVDGFFRNSEMKLLLQEGCERTRFLYDRKLYSTELNILYHRSMCSNISNSL